MQVHNGAGPLNGSDTFTRRFEGLPPINEEAAKRIERLEALSLKVIRLASVGDQNFIECLRSDDDATTRLRLAIVALEDELRES